MRTLLIEDNNCKKIAGAITVNSGHFNDDNDCQGLSHLLEHSLFLGSEPFPQTNAFSIYLDSVGGSINALTGTEYSSYFFDFPVEALNIALSHIYAMLSKPLFDKTRILDEIKVIDAEFKLKQHDELKRLYQVHKETCNPIHPFSKFSVGNENVFNLFSTEQLIAKLKKLHANYYQPQNMCFCYVSPETIELSESTISEYLSNWQGKPTANTHQLPPLYLKEHLALQINVQPIQKTRRLLVTFALPNPNTDFQHKPLLIISHIIGDEGDGSLIHYLKNQGWGSSINVGGGIQGSNFKDFNINIQLTELGVHHLDDVIVAVFEFIKMLKTSGIETWRIKEIADINQMMWDFSDASNPLDEALHYSQSMFEYSEQYILSGEHLIDKLTPELITKWFAHFTPENMRIKLITPDVNVDQLAKWYNTPYSLEKLDKVFYQRLVNQKISPTFTLAKPNQFIATNEAPHPIDVQFDQPRQIVKQNGLSLWYGQDSKFNQPKGDCFLTFDCSAINEGVPLISAQRLWVALMNETLNQKYYQASIAGLHFHFYSHQGGFSLQTNGFRGNQLTFYAKLLNQIVTNEDFTQSFERIKERQLLALSNKLLNKPINRLFGRLAILMQQQNHLSSDVIESMKNLTHVDLNTAKNKLLNRFHLEGLMYGDWTPNEAQNIAEEIQIFRQDHTVGYRVTRGVADIRHCDTLLHQVSCQSPDPAIVIYFQSPDDSIQTTVLTMLTEQLIAGPFFNQIRTQQQLGYLVGSGYIPYNQHPGLAFYIQSPNCPVPQLIQAIYDFVAQLYSQIDKFNDIWESIKKGVIKQISEKDRNLSMKSQRLWSAIGNQDYNFSYTNKMVQIITELQFSCLKDFLSRLLSRDGFGELILHSGIELDVTSQMGITKIVDVRTFKNGTPYI